MELYLCNNWLFDILGNHYGTPMPLKDAYQSPMRRSNSIGPSNCLILPGAHASSEGKRRRNRSNVEAMASKTAESSDFSIPAVSSNTRYLSLVHCFHIFFCVNFLSLWNLDFTNMYFMPKRNKTVYWCKKKTANFLVFHCSFDPCSPMWQDHRVDWSLVR